MPAFDTTFFSSVVLFRAAQSGNLPGALPTEHFSHAIMSIQLMALVWKYPLNNHTQKLVLLALADNANDAGFCWPSIDHLAWKCDLSRQGVIDQLHVLEVFGLLVRKKQFGKVNQYSLSISDFEKEMSKAFDEAHRDEPVNGVDPGKPRDQSTALTRETPGPVNAVDYHQSTALTTPVNRVDPNHQEPSVEPSPKGGVGGELGKAWEEWTRYRKKLGKCKDWTSLYEKQLQWLRGFDEKIAVEILNQSMRQGWQGLFPLKSSNPGDGVTSGIEKRILADEFQRILSKMKAIRDSYGEHQTWGKADYERYQRMKDRRNEIKKKLGIME